MWGALENVDLASGPAGSDFDGLGRALQLTSFLDSGEVLCDEAGRVWG